MTCTDPKFWFPLPVPAGSEYSLTVVGPLGTHSAFADYDDPPPGPHVFWPPHTIDPGPRTQALTLVGVHVVITTVTLNTPGTPVQVKAEIREPGGAVRLFCRTVQNPVEKIVHAIRVV